MELLNHNSQIRQIMNRGSSEEIAGHIFYIFMRDFHLSYEEIKNLPIPVALDMLKRWQKDQDKLKNSMRIK